MSSRGRNVPLAHAVSFCALALLQAAAGAGTGSSSSSGGGGSRRQQHQSQPPPQLPAAAQQQQQQQDAQQQQQQQQQYQRYLYEGKYGLPVVRQRLGYGDLLRSIREGRVAEVRFFTTHDDDAMQVRTAPNQTEADCCDAAGGVPLLYC